MGSLRRFDLKRIISEFKIEYFFETGTWRGDGLCYASQFNFKALFSSEIMPEFANSSSLRFQNDLRVNVILNNSIDALQLTLPDIDGNCIFWLDAHYPGADEGINDYNEFADEKIRLPLEKELDIIVQRVNKFQDVILVDDLRIYELGRYDYGNISENIIPPKVRNIKFIERLFSETHEIMRSYNDEGYVYLLPKNKFKKNFLVRGYDFISLKFRDKVY
ncbi:MAG: hypothetical protein FGM46_03605 [Ferruginibacter sp.]|nr:hypothetical protein [Ferruginibacter sp.]